MSDDKIPILAAQVEKVTIQMPSDDELLKAGWVKRSRRDRLIQSVPRIGQAFWIDFPHDAYAPEFVGEHPGVVVRAARRLHDTCVVVPLTSCEQDDEKHTHKLKTNPNPVGRKKGIVAYAVCNHLYTVHLARLRPVVERGRNLYPKVQKEDLDAIIAKIRVAMPHVFVTTAENGEVEAPATDAPAAVVVVKASQARPLGPNTLTLKSRI